MFIRILFYLLLVFSLSYSQSHIVSGFAFLEGETNHSNIKVKFNASSPSAVTDSVYTDSTGYYSINIQPGIYSIIFSSINYQDYIYSIEILISGSIILDDVTLSSGNTKNISGNILGILSNDTTYVVVGDINVLQGDTLIIEAGTILGFSGFYFFNVNGLLMANGTVEDSIKITSFLDSPAPGDWGGIRFNNSTNDNSQISYSIIEFGSSTSTVNASGALVSCFNSNPTISNCRISFSIRNGIQCENANPSIQDNTIKNCNYHGLRLITSSPNISNNIISTCGRSGIAVMYTSSPMIEGNKITFCDNVGISLGQHCSSNIFHNKLYNNTRGIQVEYYSHPVIKFNDIFNNDETGIFCQYDCNPFISNNDIYNNNSIGIYYSSTCFPTITMNIIVENSIGVSSGCLPEEFSYNLVWDNNGNNLNGPFALGTGLLITENANGDSIDTYFNLFEDPNWYSTDVDNDYFLFLNQESPCIDAGGSGLSGNDTTDIGSHPYVNILSIDSDPTIKMNDIILLKNYPNPFNPSTTFSYYNPKSAHVTLKVYDILGREIRTLINEFQSKGNHKYIFNASKLSSGIYFYKLQIGNELFETKKMVVLQ